MEVDTLHKEKERLASKLVVAIKEIEELKDENKLLGRSRKLADRADKKEAEKKEKEQGNVSKAPKKTVTTTRTTRSSPNGRAS